MGLSRRAYARSRAERGLIGGTKTAVTKAIDSGRITEGPDGIDPELADRQWEEATSAGHRRNTAEEAQARAKGGESAERPEPPTGGLSLAQASAVEKAYRARLARLDWEVRVGKLVPVDEVKLEWAKIITEARTKLLGLPSKVRARIPDLSLAEMAEIDGLVREALESLAEPEQHGEVA